MQSPSPRWLQTRFPILEHLFLHSQGSAILRHIYPSSRNSNLSTSPLLSSCNCACDIYCCSICDSGICDCDIYCCSNCDSGICDCGIAVVAFQIQLNLYEWLQGHCAIYSYYTMPFLALSFTLSIFHRTSATLWTCGPSNGDFHQLNVGYSHAFN